MKSKTIIENGVVQTLCRQCDMRCSVNVHILKGKIVKLSGHRPHPESRGRICAKALAALDWVYHPDRLLNPLKRQPDGTFAHISYDRALDEIARRMTAIREKYGSRALGVWTGEAIGFFQQEEYARRFIHAFGSPNYFSAESVCYASRYMAYHLVRGYYSACPDFANARTIVLWGTNLGATHPPFMRRVDQARQNGARLVVIDPRRTAAARKADLFVQPVPGTDAALAWGLARYLIQSGNYDRGFVDKYTTGFKAFANYAQRFTPQVVQQETGVSANTVIEMGRWLATSSPRVSQYTGISLEHQPNGLDTVRIIACLDGLTGAVDHAGGDTWPRDFKRRSLTLYDELPLENLAPIGADRFAMLYHFRRQCHSMTAMDYMLGNGDYPFRGLIITGANPVLSNPNANKVSRALDSLDLLVFRDLFLTQSARHAHYVLPAASFLERSELHFHVHQQLVNLTTKVLDVSGVTDEYTFWHDLAHRLGSGKEFFPWKNEEEVNRWLLETGSISIETLQDHPEGVRYAPVEDGKYSKQPFPTPSGKFEFTSTVIKKWGYAALPQYVPPPHRPHRSHKRPFVLITGARSPLYYHSRYRNIPRFQRAVAKPELEIHFRDAARLGITDGERVRVVSAVGAIEVEVTVIEDHDIIPGVVQIGHGWDEANVNLLTDDADLDPASGYPNMKIVAVSIEKGH